MILYLVRHGIAVDRTDPKSPPEAERPLTAKGVQKTRSAALGLKGLGVKPDALLSSPYVRAAQTAEIFAEALGCPPQKIRASEAAGNQPATRRISSGKSLLQLKAKEVICFGHAPHLDQMIAQLSGARGVFTGLKKAGVACFEQAARNGRWELIWIVTPKMLRQLG